MFGDWGRRKKKSRSAGTPRARGSSVRFFQCLQCWNPRGPFEAHETNLHIFSQIWSKNYSWWIIKGYGTSASKPGGQHRLNEARTPVDSCRAFGIRWQSMSIASNEPEPGWNFWKKIVGPVEVRWHSGVPSVCDGSRPRPRNLSPSTRVVVFPTGSKLLHLPPPRSTVLQSYTYLILQFYLIREEKSTGSNSRTFLIGHLGQEIIYTRSESGFHACSIANVGPKGVLLVVLLIDLVT